MMPFVCIGANVNVNVTDIGKVAPWKPGRPVLA